ncbi:hypothetical protein ACFYYH_14465 [Streptomyces sp. NPDC002018]
MVQPLGQSVGRPVGPWGIVVGVVPATVRLALALALALVRVLVVPGFG